MRRRFDVLDAWRTLAIVLMVAYHFLYDLYIFGIISADRLFSTPLNILERFICCSFILLAGASARFSRNNLRRGLIVLAAGLARIAPEGRVKVQKSQISFYDGGLFAMASLPKRKGDPGLVVSFGLGRRDPSPRIGAAVEPYPGRWTHHAALTREADLDGELLGWLEEARGFCRAKGRGKA